MSDNWIIHEILPRTCSGLPTYFQQTIASNHRKSLQEFAPPPGSKFSILIISIVLFSSAVLFIISPFGSFITHGTPWVQHLLLTNEPQQVIQRSLVAVLFTTFVSVNPSVYPLYRRVYEGYRYDRRLTRGYTEGSFALQVGISINQN